MRCKEQKRAIVADRSNGVWWEERREANTGGGSGRKKGGACFDVLTTGTEVFRRFSATQIMVRQVIVIDSHPINLSYHRLGGHHVESEIYQIQSRTD